LSKLSWRSRVFLFTVSASGWYLQEIGSLEFQKENTFKAPAKEWINHRLEALRETLNKNTASSSLALKELMAPIKFEPILAKDSDYYQLFDGQERDFKPYYVAMTKIRTLALLDEKHKGSNWYQWRRVVYYAQVLSPCAS